MEMAVKISRALPALCGSITKNHAYGKDSVSYAVKSTVSK
jgi:hypothetical protein